VDTFFIPFTSFLEITGTSENDVWVCGPGDSQLQFFHFDGEEWTAVPLNAPFQPYSISSSGYKQIWTGGSDGHVYSYDGKIWRKELQHQIDIADQIYFDAIKVFDETEVIASGQYWLGENNQRGLLMHYKGSEWTELRLDSIKTALIDIEISMSSRIFIHGSTYEQFAIDRYHFYEYNEGIVKLLHSGTQAVEEKGSLLQLGNETYFIIGPDFYEYDGTQFNLIGKLSDDPKFLNVAFGRNKNDIFLGMRDGIAHYNGENTEYVYQSDTNIFARWGIVFDDHVFFIGTDPSEKSFVIRGIRND
jgi:hypothetical protein